MTDNRLQEYSDLKALASAARKRLSGMQRHISDCARKLERPLRLRFDNAGTGPQSFYAGTTERFDIQKWPSRDQLESALKEFIEASEKVEQAYGFLSPDQRAAAQPPEAA